MGETKNIRFYVIYSKGDEHKRNGTKAQYIVQAHINLLGKVDREPREIMS